MRTDAGPVAHALQVMAVVGLVLFIFYYAAKLMVKSYRGFADPQYEEPDYDPVEKFVDGVASIGLFATGFVFIFLIPLVAR